MKTEDLKNTIDKLELLKTKAKTISEVLNIDMKINLLKKKLNKRYDND